MKHLYKIRQNIVNFTKSIEFRSRKYICKCWVIRHYSLRGTGCCNVKFNVNECFKHINIKISLTRYTCI